MASSRIVSRIAQRLGLTFDEAAPAVAHLDDDEALTLLSRLDQSSASRTFAGVLADQPQRIASTGFSAGQTALLGTAAIGGGAFVGSEFLQNERERIRRLAKQDQSAALRAIMENPHLSSEEKQRLVDDLVGAGFFDPASGDGDGDGGGFINDIFGEVGFLEAVVIVIVVWWTARTISKAAEG